MSRVLSPIELMALLYHTGGLHEVTALDLKRAELNLVERGLLNLDAETGSGFESTDRGLAHTQHLLTEPLPVARVVWQPVDRDNSDQFSDLDPDPDEYDLL